MPYQGAVCGDDTGFAGDRLCHAQRNVVRLGPGANHDGAGDPNCALWRIIRKHEVHDDQIGKGGSDGIDFDGKHSGCG